MKYIKIYESIRKDLKRGDLIIRDDDLGRESYVYLVLNHLHRNKRKINVYCIGYMKYESFNIINNDFFNNLKIHTIYKMEDVRLLEENEILKIVKQIYSRIENSYYNKKIEIIKNDTGIDLREIPEYIQYDDEMTMIKNISKYNL